MDKIKKYTKNCFDLDTYIKQNHSQIVECNKNKVEFLWEDKAVQAVYMLTNDILKSMGICGENKEDILQECVYDFFSHIVNEFKPELGFKISTYATISIRRKVEKIINNKSYQFNESIIKLDRPRNITKNENNDPSIYDIVDPTTDMASGSLCEKEAYKQYMRNLAAQDSIIYRYYYQNKNFREIAEENRKNDTNPKTHQGVGMHISRTLKKMRKDIKDSEYCPER